MSIPQTTGTHASLGEAAIGEIWTAIGELRQELSSVRAEVDSVAAYMAKELNRRRGAGEPEPFNIVKVLRNGHWLDPTRAPTNYKPLTSRTAVESLTSEELDKYLVFYIPNEVVPTEHRIARLHGAIGASPWYLIHKGE